MIKIEIQDLNENFEGIGEFESKKVIVPGALPDDYILASIDQNKSNYIKASISEIIRPSEIRAKPPCIHFSECGGCSLQYMEVNEYIKHKTNILKNLIKNLGFNPNVLQETISVGPFARRRASFKVENNKIGYYKAQTHQIFDIKECLVLEPEVLNLIPEFKCLIKQLKNIPKNIDVTLADNGLDIIFYVENEFELEDLELLNKFADANNILRISINQNGRIFPLIIKTYPKLIFDNIEVNLPENLFLQASKKSQKLIIKLIIKYLAKYKKIADLYSGIGTYSFPLSEYARLDMFEGDEKMVNAANNAAKNNNPHAKLRNLHLSPLTGQEINNYDAVIINPPRNGAERQIRQIAASNIKKLVMVSCNHKTFKRDAEILKNAGFVLEEAVLIDQFYYTDHFEIFTSFKNC